MLMTTTSRSVDELEQELFTLESMVSRIRAKQLNVITQLDQAQVCVVDGARTLGEWVTGRLDVAPETGRVLAYAATSESRILGTELAAGDVSFDRVVATRRLANTGTDNETLAMASGVAVHHVRRLTTRHTEMTPTDETRIFETRRLFAQPNLANTTWNLHGRLPAADGEMVFAALEDTADALTKASDPLRPTLPQRRADALVAWGMNHLDPAGAESDAPAVSERLATTIHIDHAIAAKTRGQAGATTRGGVKVGPNTLQELLCIGGVSTITIDQGTVMTVGVTGRDLPPGIREYIWRRDGGCTVDGCTSTYRLEVHHIIHRDDGGDHHPDNLTLLCWYHHHIVIHHRKFTLNPDSPPGRRRLVPPSPDRDPPEP